MIAFGQPALCTAALGSPFCKILGFVIGIAFAYLIYRRIIKGSERMDMYTTLEFRHKSGTGRQYGQRTAKTCIS